MWLKCVFFLWLTCRSQTQHWKYSIWCCSGKSPFFVLFWTITPFKLFNSLDWILFATPVCTPITIQFLDKVVYLLYLWLLTANFLINLLLQVLFLVLVPDTCTRHCLCCLLVLKCIALDPMKLMNVQMHHNASGLIWQFILSNRSVFVVNLCSSLQNSNTYSKRCCLLKSLILIFNRILVSIDTIL